MAANIIPFGLSWPIIKIGLEASTPLALGTALIIAGIAMVILDRPPG